MKIGQPYQSQKIKFPVRSLNWNNKQLQRTTSQMDRNQVLKADRQISALNRLSRSSEDIIIVSYDFAF